MMVFFNIILSSGSAFPTAPTDAEQPDSHADDRDASDERCSRTAGPSSSRLASNGATRSNAIHRSATIEVPTYLFIFK